MQRAANRGFITYESSLWPRPSHCHARRQAPAARHVTDVPPGTCEPEGKTCDKYRISRAYRFVWHHVWKGGTTSLSPYLSCNFDALPVAGLLHALPSTPPGYIHVGTSREPIGRFLSAFQEVYTRLRLPRLHATSAAENGGKGGKGGGGGEEERCYHRRVPWLLVAMSNAERPHAAACAQADAPLSAAALRAVFRQFVADVECATHYSNVEHLYSQSLFLGGNTSSRHDIELLLRLESLSEDMRSLKRAVRYGKREDACPLRVERSASDKPRAVPSRSALWRLLEEEPSLLQSVCNVYMQDFICLGYPLPRGCELQPPRAATQPETMNITPASLPGGREREGAGGKKPRRRNRGTGRRRVRRVPPPATDEPRDSFRTSAAARSVAGSLRASVN